MIHYLHLIGQITCIVAWIVLLPYAVKHKKNIHVDMFWPMIGSIVSIGSTLIYELRKNDFVMTWNAWWWYPTNLCLVFTLFTAIKINRKHTDLINWKPENETD